MTAGEATGSHAHHVSLYIFNKPCLPNLTQSVMINLQCVGLTAQARSVEMVVRL